MSEKIPIIFVHRAPADYLAYAAAQARHANPDSRIVALLDYEDPIVSRYAEVVSIFDHLEDVREFERDFINFSNLNYDYTCLCCQRWLILRNFARKQGMPRFLYVDSDVMCYADITEEMKPYQGSDICYSGGSAHTLYVENFGQYEEFCDFMIRRYRDNASVVEMREYYRRHKEKFRFGGIQDMEHWIAYDKGRDKRLGNFAFEKEGVVVSTHAKFWDEQKKREVLFPFEWKNGQPYGTDRYSKNHVRYSTIHFQGVFKKHMAPHFTGDPAEAVKIQRELKIRNASKRVPGISRALDIAGKLGAAKMLQSCRVHYRPQALTYSK